MYDVQSSMLSLTHPQTLMYKNFNMVRFLKSLLPSLSCMTVCGSTFQRTVHQINLFISGQALYIKVFSQCKSQMNPNLLCETIIISHFC